MSMLTTKAILLSYVDLIKLEVSPNQAQNSRAMKHKASLPSFINYETI